MEDNNFKKYLKYKRKYLAAKTNGKQCQYFPELCIPEMEQFKAQPVSWVKDYDNTDSVSSDEYEKAEYKLVSDEQMVELCKKCTAIYSKIHGNNNSIFSKIFSKKQDVFRKKVIDNDAKVAFFGDYHSSLHSFIKCLQKLRDGGDFFIQGTWKLKEKRYLVFLGDLVDRGPYGVEVIYIAFRLFEINNRGKGANQDTVIILNGNHEDPQTNERYGFKKETSEQFQDETKAMVYKLMENLPEVIFMKSGNTGTGWYQFCHGGIDKKTQETSNWCKNFLSGGVDIARRPEDSVSGYKWSDFNMDNTKNYGIYSSRGAGSVYGIKACTAVFQKNNIKSIISGHQDNISFAFLPREEKGKYGNKWEYPAYYEYARNRKYSYNLFGPKNSDARTRESDSPNPLTIDLPMKDCLALVISSATQSKDVARNSFGVLDIATNRSTINLF
jgi:hypothetical protein